MNTAFRIFWNLIIAINAFVLGGWDKEFNMPIGIAYLMLFGLIIIIFLRPMPSPFHSWWKCEDEDKP